MKWTLTYILCVVVTVVIMITVSSCQHAHTVIADRESERAYTPVYATGFYIDTIVGTNSALITVTSPWQGADSVVSQLLIDNDNLTDPREILCNVIKGPARRIVVMSSSHIAMLDALNATDHIVGVSGLRFITSQAIQSGRDTIADVGYDGNYDYEALVACRPDLVLLYGVYGASQLETRLIELGIPYLYIGDYIEESPLGKAEWVVPLAWIVGDPERGVDLLKPVVSRYDSISNLVSERLLHRPKVMINTPYGDSWFMPPNDSYMVRLLNDAGGEYIYKGNDTDSSLPIDMELAWSLTRDADVWINTGRCTSLDQLEAECPRLIDASCVRWGRVYNNTRLTNNGGGNDFYESGIMHPDVILHDLVNIFHPDLLTDTVSLVYYMPLR